MRVYRCPRCRAEDITTDAHPTRVLHGDEPFAVLVCRACYRASELEFRIACETRGLAHPPLGIREALRLLETFYRERVAEWSDTDLLVEDSERASRLAAIESALADVRRRLRIRPLN